MFRFVFHLQAEKHHPALVKVLCSALGVDPEALLDFELCLTDTQPAVSVQINRWCSVTAANPDSPPQSNNGRCRRSVCKLSWFLSVS